MSNDKFTFFFTVCFENIRDVFYFGAIIVFLGSGYFGIKFDAILSNCLIG